MASSIEIGGSQGLTLNAYVSTPVITDDKSTDITIGR
jgi:hypothetical protein